MLETLFLLSRHSNIELLKGHLFSFRNLDTPDPRNFSFWFSNSDLTTPIKLETTYEANNQDNVIKSNYRAIFNSENNINGIKLISNYNDNESESECIYNEKKPVHIGKGFSVGEDPFTIKNISENNVGNLIETRIITLDSPSVIHTEELTSLNRKGDEAVKNLIKDINEIYNEDITSIFQADKILEFNSNARSSSLPLTFLGNGVSKVVTFFTIVNANYKMILIDEIETGLHYTKMKKIFQVLFRKAIQKKIQLFITTHSEDVLKAIESILNEDKEIGESYKHYGLIRNEENKVQSISYTKDEFLGSRQTSQDIRD